MSALTKIAKLFPDMDAHTLESFSKLMSPEEMGPKARAMNFFRGNLGYTHNPNTPRITSKQIKDYNRVRDIEEGSQGALLTAEEGIERWKLLQNLPIDDYNQNYMPEDLLGSLVTLDKPLYTTRTPHYYAHGSPTNRPHRPEGLYSASAANPNTLKDTALNKNEMIYKIPKGEKVYHPSSLADPNEVILTGKQMYGPDVQRMRAKEYLGYVKKGTAPFAVGGAGVISGLNPDRADADVGSITGDYPMGYKGEPNVTLLDIAEMLRGADKRLGGLSMLTPFDAMATLLDKHAFKAPRSYMDYYDAVP